jgi:hypothetical protein
MSQSDTVRTLRARLAGGIVQFTFTKVNGETREAEGTTNLEIVPPAFRPNGTGKRTPEDLIAYFDLGRMAWRSLRTENLVSIDD